MSIREQLSKGSSVSIAVIIAEIERLTKQQDELADAFRELRGKAWESGLELDERLPVKILVKEYVAIKEQISDFGCVCVIEDKGDVAYEIRSSQE